MSQFCAKGPDGKHMHAQRDMFFAIENRSWTVCVLPFVFTWSCWVSQDQQEELVQSFT